MYSACTIRGGLTRHKLTSRGWGLQAANTPTRMSYIEISKVPTSKIMKIIAFN